MVSFNPPLEETQKAGLFTLYIAKQDRRKRGCMLILKTSYQKGRSCFFSLIRVGNFYSLFTNLL